MSSPWTAWMTFSSEAADPAAGYVLVYYAAREVREIFFTGH